MARVKVSAAMAAIGFLLAAPATSDDTADALAIFKEYADRSGRFDAALADLYADDAVIRAKRLGPDGRVQNLSFTGSQWKALIRQAMPQAEQRGDRNSFRDVSAKSDSTGIMITANRYSHLKNHTSPWAILVTKQQTGGWKISAEIIETRP